MLLLTDNLRAGRGMTAKVELMSEVMVYGTKVWANSGYEVGCINSQLPLFALAPEYIHRRFDYWLRGVGVRLTSLVCTATVVRATATPLILMVFARSSSLIKMLTEI